MNKSLYDFGIFFLGLTVACILLQNTVQFLVGVQLYTEASFVAWFLVANIVSLIGILFLLKYYYYRKYWSAYYMGMISTVASFCYVVILFIMLLSRASNNYYIYVLLISLFIGIVYALTLVFSGTGKKIWLKIAGTYMFVIYLMLMLTIAWPLISKDVQFNSILAKIAQWVSLVGSLISIPFIIHFFSETKILDIESPAPINESLKNTLITVKTLTLIAALVTGIMVATESYSSIYWGNKNFENAKKLARLFEARTFVNRNGDTLFYHLLMPLNFDPKKKYPLLISLPYGGGTDKIRQIEGAAAAELLSTDVNRKKYPAFLFVPNCPAGSGWGGIPNYPSADSLVYDAITSLDTVFPIDAKKRYVTGISKGGYGSWHFICTRPDLFAAAIPVCGGEDPKLASRIVNVAVWAFHGAKDQNAPVTGSRNMIEAMRKSGQKPRYTEYPNEGHNIWYQVSTTPGLWDWLFAQKNDKASAVRRL
ncbi:MAG TPA: hypothetical protein VK563_15115 [Puia sp.]|nr:hypothetical protein [Puia sp.]